MINYFLKEYSIEYNVEKPIISNDAMDFLNDFEWYGNTRQLKNLVLRMLLLQNGEIDMKVVRLCLGDQLQRDFEEYGTINPQKETIIPLKEAERNFRIKYISAVRNLFPTDAEAAKYLGIAKSNFHRLLKELNLK
jgi:DNA-binding NtrC family response regulator